MAADPTFFSTPEAFGEWLAAHHGDASELLVGFHKVGSGRPSMTWPQAVDEALCFGWIDGVRRRVDDRRYSIRFTPRMASSTWSAVNIRRVGELADEGRMRPAGERAFAARRADRSRTYAYEQPGELALDPSDEAALRANADAWAFFSARPPSYRTPAIWWVVSAKRPETRARRLATLIDDSANGRTLRHLTRTPRRPPPK